MDRARRLLFPVLILGLLALAAFGIRQVIVDRAQPQPDVPPPREEHESVFEEETEWQRQALRDFIDSGGDICSLPVGEFTAHPGGEYPDLPSLMNDVDVIVLGRPVQNVLEPPKPGTIVGRVLTTVQVEEALKGSPPGPTVLLESGHKVGAVKLEGGEELMRGSMSKFDVCDPSPALLFVRSWVRGEFSVGHQGWVRIDGDAVEAAAYNQLFDAYASAQALLDAVRQIVEEQQAQGLPKGRLLCEFKRTSPNQAAPVACPGEIFNPYQALQLDSAGGAWVSTTDPGPSPREVASVKLEPGDPRLSTLLSALDLEVHVEPFGVNLDDVITVSVELAESVRDPPSFPFWYSPSAGIVQMPPYGGQFPAPPAFQQAMEPFLAAPSP